MRIAGGLGLGTTVLDESLAESVAHPGDLALARQAASRDEAAWRHIYDGTRDRLFGILCYYTGRREEALELLQETYLSAIESIHRYQGEGPLAGWLAVIAIRRARDWRRRMIRGRRSRHALELERAADPPGAPDEERRIRLRDALGQLKGRRRAVFLLREMEGLSFREIGRALGCSEATARVHHFRAREMLRAMLIAHEIHSQEMDEEPSAEGVMKTANASRDGDDEEERT